jgi:hypothetical protein
MKDKDKPKRNKIARIESAVIAETLRRAPSSETKISFTSCSEPPKVQPFSASNHCSKNVVVARSEPVKSGIDGSDADRCNCLKNIVLSTIFRTAQKTRQVC